MKKILIIAAHPDDEILGCAGTIAKLVNEGHEAYTLILGEGVTARDTKRKPEERTNNLSELKTQAIAANKIIGVKEVFTYNFPDNRFDSVPLLDIIKTIEIIKEKIKPDMIFTHNQHDLNIDHQITYKAVLTSCRPLPQETVKEIYSFEVLSSSEWNYPQNFNPNLFYDISSTINLKIKAMKEYYTEIREYPHPRSSEGIMINSNLRGLSIGMKHAEAFQVIRIIK